MQLLGMILIILTYAAIALHCYGFFTVVLLVLKRRLGVFFGLTWVSIGIALTYNIVFNYFWACLIKPGSPSDLKMNEQIRKEIKNQESRKAAKVAINDNGTVSNEIEDDRFEGL